MTVIALGLVALVVAIFLIIFVVAGVIGAITLIHGRMTRAEKPAPPN